MSAGGVEGVEFGPSAAERRGWGLVGLLVAGGVVAYALLVPRVLLIPLVALFPLAPFVVGGFAARMRPPTAVAEDGVRCHAVFSVQLRRQFVPWAAIAWIGVLKRGRRAHVALRLTDGGRIFLQHPNGRQVQDAVAFMQRRHLAACGGTPPAIDGAPLPWRRLRPWVRGTAIVLPVVSLVGPVAWIVAETGGGRSPDAVVACDQIPRDVVARVLPEGSAHSYGHPVACRWSTDSTSESGTWIDFHIGAWSRSYAERSYEETLQAMRDAGRKPTMMRDGDAYTVAWQDGWGFTAQGRAHVKGYLVIVALHNRRAASADEAGRQAGDVLRAVTEKLA